MAPKPPINPITPALQQLAQLRKPTAEDRRLLGQNERAAKAAVLAAPAAPKKFPPGQKPSAITKAEKEVDPSEDYYNNLFGEGWGKGLNPGTYEANVKLTQIRDTALEKGVSEKEAEAIITGKKSSTGIEDKFYEVLGSGPAQTFFAFGPVAKALGLADVYSKYTQRSIVAGLGEFGLPKLDQFGVPTGERFLLAPEDEATFQDKINDPTYGYGSQFPLNSKEYIDLSGVPGLGAANKWIDRISGFTGDILTSPETWFSGVGGIARKVLGAGLEAVGEQTARRAVLEGAEEGAAAAGRRAALEVGETTGQRAMGLAGLTRRNALEELAAARLARTAAEEATGTVAARVAAGGLPEEAIVARTSAAAAEARIAAAEKKLARANKDVAVLRPSGAYVGPQTRQAAAKTVLDIRDGARATLDTGEVIDANDIARAATPVELELARLTLEAIPEDLASEIAVRGIQVLGKKEYAQAAKVLGYESGIKFKVPFAPLETAVIIPGSGKITKALGLGTSGLRSTVFGSKLGRAAVDFFVPVAADSIVNNLELLTDWETALRTGKIKDATTGIIRNATPAELDDIARIFSADVQYRGLTNLRIKNYAPMVIKTVENQDPAVIAKVAPLLYAIDSKWTPALRALYESLDETELAFYNSYLRAADQMATDSRAFARTYGAVEDLIPANKLSPVQSRQFVKWANQNKGALNVLAKQLGIDSSELLAGFIDKALKEGSTWFGKRLTKVDLQKGVPWLNEIARKSKYNIDFDVLTAAPGEALVRLAQKHARYQAYIYSLDKLAGGLGPIRRGAGELKGGQKPQILNKLNTVENTVANFVTPENVAKWSIPKSEEIFAKTRAIAEAFEADTVRKTEINEAIMALDTELKAVTAAVDAGELPEAALAVVGEGAQAYANSLMEEVLGAKQSFWSSDPAKWQAMVPTMLDEGFQALIPKVPGMFVDTRSEIARMFQNITDVANDPKKLQAWTTAYNNLLSFQKTWMTGTTRFHSRNAQQAIMQFIVKGGLVNNAIDFIRVNKDWLRANKAGIPIEEWASDYARKIYPSKTRRSAVLRLEYEQILRQTFGYSGSTMGEVGELVARTDVGQRVGITGTGPARNRLSGALANNPFIIPAATAMTMLPPGVSRRIGTTIEDFSRALYMYDGLLQGLSPSEAQASVNRFLFDYGKSSKADRALGLLYPFIKYNTRNMALQLSAVWTNPKVYAYYNLLAKELNRGEEKNPWLSADWILYGVNPFGELGGQKTYLKPDLGIPATSPNFLTQIIYSVLNPDPNSGGVLTPFAQSTSPTLKAVVEALVYGKPVGSPVSIYKKENFGGPLFQNAMYVMRQTVPPVPAAGRVLKLAATLTPGAPGRKANELVANKFAAALFGTRELTEEEQTAAAQIAIAFNAMGFPIVWLSDAAQTREIWKRYFDFDERISEIEKSERKYYEENINELQPSTVTTIQE
jgi:hypothetical protein